MRVKRGITSHAKHKKLLVANKGYRMTKRRLVKVAKQAYLHAGEHAFAGRKLRKREFRELWISRISESVKQNGLSYSAFINKLKARNIEIDRKMLANLIIDHPDAFAAVLEKSKSVN